MLNLPFLQTQIHDLKQAQSQNTVNLHSMALDPAVNLVFQKMKSELHSTKEQLEQAQSDLSAWKFTPDRYNLWHMAYIIITVPNHQTETNELIWFPCA